MLCSHVRGSESFRPDGCAWHAPVRAQLAIVWPILFRKIRHIRVRGRIWILRDAAAQGRCSVAQGCSWPLLRTPHCLEHIGIPIVHGMHTDSARTRYRVEKCLDSRHHVRCTAGTFHIPADCSLLQDNVCRLHVLRAVHVSATDNYQQRVLVLPYR